MRNFLLGGIFTLILIWLISGICEVRIWKVSETQDKQEQKEPLKEYKLGWNKCTLYFNYVIIDEHQYLIYFDGYRGGITHSPKCNCITNLIKNIKQ